MRCLFAINIWGARYIDNFVRVTLPTHMAPGNLGQLPDIDFCKYVIFTCLEDVDYILSTPQIQALQRLMPVEVVPVNFPKGDKYQLLGSLQNAAFCKAHLEGFDAVFPLYADALFADGTFANAVKRIGEGYLAVVAPGPQALAEPVREALLTPELYLTESGAIAVPPRKLVDLVFTHLHPFHAPAFWDADRFTSIPSMVFWNVPGQGVLVHGFHLHPVAIATQPISTFISPFHGTLDEHFLPRMLSCADKVYVAVDSDEIFVCSIDSLGERAGEAADARNKASVAHLANWAERHTFMLHRDFFGYPIRLRCADGDESAWADCERQAERIVERTLYRLSVADSTLKYEDRNAYESRVYHRGVQARAEAVLRLYEPTAHLAQHIVARMAMPLVQRQAADRLMPPPQSFVIDRMSNWRPFSWVDRLPWLSRRLLSLPKTIFVRWPRRMLSFSWLRPPPPASPDIPPSAYRNLWVTLRDSYYDADLLRLPQSKICSALFMRLGEHLTPRSRQHRKMRVSVNDRDSRASPSEGGR
jgi:hypothetical protein